jgi:hypothetical protein
MSNLLSNNLDLYGNTYQPAVAQAETGNKPEAVNIYQACIDTASLSAKSFSELAVQSTPTVEVGEESEYASYIELATRYTNIAKFIGQFRTEGMPSSLRPGLYLDTVAFLYKIQKTVLETATNGWSTGIPFSKEITPNNFQQYAGGITEIARELQQANLLYRFIPINPDTRLTLKS